MTAHTVTVEPALAGSPSASRTPPPAAAASHLAETALTAWRLRRRRRAQGHAWLLPCARPCCSCSTPWCSVLASLSALPPPVTVLSLGSELARLATLDLVTTSMTLRLLGVKWSHCLTTTATLISNRQRSNSLRLPRGPLTSATFPGAHSLKWEHPCPS